MDAVPQLNTALEGRYAIEREIGRGGMATVYLARDLRHDRHVALKVLNPELGAVLGVERFLSEIRVTANLQHPNLLPLFDSGESNGLLFYVMPFIEGETLRHRLDREKQLPVDEAVRIAIGVASALDYAHRHSVVHRDLKPENILLQDGQPVVADFGIALAVSAAGGARVTQTGLSLGTPQYMSPEQATGDRTIDGRSDIYSLAAVTYEMLAGEPPHLGSTVQSIIARVLTETPPSVRVRRPAVSPAVAAAIEHALEKLPADRFSTAHDFAESLQGRGSAVPSQPSRAPETTSGPSRSFAWPVMTILTCAAAVIAGAGWWRAANVKRSDSPVAFTIALAAGERPYTFVAGSTVAISPDEKTVAYLAGVGNTSRRLYIRRLGDLWSRPIAGTELATQPFFSPDGAWLGFVVGTQIRKVTLDGATAVSVAELGAAPSGLSWNANGEMVASANGKLMIVPEGGGAPRSAASEDTATSGSRRWPRWLPGGRDIVHTVWKGSLPTARIAVLSTKTGEFTDVGVAGAAPLGVTDGRLVYVGPSGSLMSVEFDHRSLRAVGTPVPVVDDAMAAGDRVGGINAALADDGSLIYVRGVAAMQPVLADSTGTKPLVSDLRNFSFPRYSPNGKYIVLEADEATNTQLWLLEVASGTLTKLTTEGTINDRAEWLPDSKHVLFRSDRSGKSVVWSQAIDGSAPAQMVFADPNADIWEALLSPDGRTLIYRTGTTGSADIWYRALEGDTTRKALAATTFNEWEPRLSPDGKWVAYSSNESGAFQVYVRAFPIAGPRIQVSADGGGAPVWSRDGRRIFYTQNAEVHSALVTTSGEFKVVSRTRVLQGDYSFPAGHANYDDSPTGRLLMIKRRTGDIDIVVVHKWRADPRGLSASRPAK